MSEKYAENIRKKDDIAGLISGSIGDVIWMVPFSVDEQSFVSDSIKALLGYSPEAFLELSVNKVLDASSYERFLQVLEYYKEIQFTITNNDKPGKFCRIFEFKFVDSAGKIIWVESVANVYCSRQKEPLGVIFSLRNITGRKKLEENYSRQLNKQLELNKFKSQVISTISHEFRTPISVIYSNLQLLKKFRYNIEEGIQNDAFELTTMAIHSLSKTLDNLTLLNQSNKGVLGFDMQDIDLEVECKKIATEINSIDDYSGRILTNFDIREKLVKMDKKLLHHILSNLIINALKFSPGEKKVEFNAMNKNGKIEFRVKDQGIGIPEEELNQIFESFYRGTNTKEIKGTGLGLSIVKRCVDVLNGKISIKSRLDNGTEAIVTIPYERSEP